MHYKYPYIMMFVQTKKFCVDINMLYAKGIQSFTEISIHVFIISTLLHSSNNIVVFSLITILSIFYYAKHAIVQYIS